MMGIQNFLSFVEIRTKLASVIPFALGLSYAFYVTGHISLGYTAIFFLADILFDMSVTAINNHIDKRSEAAKPHYSNAVGLTVILSMIIPALAIGLILAYKFGVPVCFAGAVCVCAGVFYTFGPAPISRSPYGEIISGVVEGGFLPFIVYSINAPANPLFGVSIGSGLNAVVSLDGIAITRAFLVFFPAIALIANIMLANNICDVEQDRGRRYTLPMHIGTKRSVTLYEVIAVLAFGDIVVASLTGAASILCLCVVPSAFLVIPNILKFHRRQSKGETFKYSVTNFALVTFLFALFMYIGATAGL